MCFAAPGGPPQNINFTIIGIRNLTLSWEAPEQDLQYGTILGYNITYKLSGSEEVMTKTLKGSYNLVLDDLLPYTLYSISVSAFTSVGLGRAAEREIRTQADCMYLVCLVVCLCVFMCACVCLYVWLPICAFIFQLQCLFVCLFIYLFICLFISLFVCLFICLIICLFVYLFACLFVICLFICLFDCLCICLFIC